MAPEDAIPVEVIRNGGHLSAGDRISRNEELIARLADRVNTKANFEDVREQIDASEVRLMLVTDEIKRDIQRLNERMAQSESGDTMAARMFLERFDSMEQTVKDIQQHGSSQAQEAQKEISVIIGRVEQLKEENVKYNTLQSRQVEEQVSRVRFWTIMIAVMNVLIVAANLAVILATRK